MDLSNVLNIVPPKYLPYVMVGLIAFKAADFALQGLHLWFPNNKTISVLEHWSCSIAPRLPKTLTPPPPPVIGSPIGSPKGFAMLKYLSTLVVVSAVAATIACAHVTPLEQSLINCGEQALSSAATQLGPQVLGVLSGGSVNWASDLTALVGTAGNGVICAVQAIVASVQGKAAMGALAPVDQVVLIRAQAWLDSQGVKLTPVAGSNAHH